MADMKDEKKRTPEQLLQEEADRQNRQQKIERAKQRPRAARIGTAFESGHTRPLRLLWFSTGSMHPIRNVYVRDFEFPEEEGDAEPLADYRDSYLLPVQEVISHSLARALHKMEVPVPPNRQGLVKYFPIPDLPLPRVRFPLIGDSFKEYKELLDKFMEFLKLEPRKVSARQLPVPYAQQGKKVWPAAHHTYDGWLIDMGMRRMPRRSLIPLYVAIVSIYLELKITPDDWLLYHLDRTPVTTAQTQWALFLQEGKKLIPNSPEFKMWEKAKQGGHTWTFEDLKTSDGRERKEVVMEDTIFWLLYYLLTLYTNHVSTAWKQRIFFYNHARALGVTHLVTVLRNDDMYEEKKETDGILEFNSNFQYNLYDNPYMLYLRVSGLDVHRKKLLGLLGDDDPSVDVIRGIARNSNWKSLTMALVDIFPRVRISRALRLFKDDDDVRVAQSVIDKDETDDEAEEGKRKQKKKKKAREPPTLLKQLGPNVEHFIMNLVAGRARVV